MYHVFWDTWYVIKDARRGIYGCHHTVRVSFSNHAIAEVKVSFLLIRTLKRLVRKQNGISGQNYYNARNCDISLTIFHAELILYRTIAGQKLKAGKGGG